MSEFFSALAEADRRLRDHGVPPATERRLRRRLERTLAPRPAPARAVAWAAASAVAAAAVAAALWMARGGEPPRQVAAGLVVERASADLRYQVGPDESVRVDAGEGELFDEASRMRVRTRGPVELRREPDGVRLVRGQVEVHVAPRAPGAAPAQILVSHGVIEVVGTRFAVEQRDGEGEVAVRQGQVRFHAASGEVYDLGAGDGLAWPRVPGADREVVVPEPPPPDTAPTTEPAATKAPTKPATRRAEVVDVKERRPKELLDRLAVLRSHGRYPEAARVLADALADEELPLALRERLSFELGAILADRLGDQRAACGHFRRHQRRYRGGRYGPELVRRLDECSRQRDERNDE